MFHRRFHHVMSNSHSQHSCPEKHTEALWALELRPFPLLLPPLLTKFKFWCIEAGANKLLESICIEGRDEWRICGDS